MRLVLIVLLALMAMAPTNQQTDNLACKLRFNPTLFYQPDLQYTNQVPELLTISSMSDDLFTANVTHTLSEGAVVLELTPEDAFSIEDMLRKGAAVIVSDPSTDVLNAAFQRFKSHPELQGNLKLLKRDLPLIPLPNESVSVVRAKKTFNKCDDPKIVSRSISEISRVLNKNGALVVHIDLPWSQGDVTEMFTKKLEIAGFLIEINEVVEVITYRPDLGRAESRTQVVIVARKP